MLHFHIDLKNDFSSRCFFTYAFFISLFFFALLILSSDFSHKQQKIRWTNGMFGGIFFTVNRCRRKQTGDGFSVFPRNSINKFYNGCSGNKQPLNFFLFFSPPQNTQHSKGFVGWYGHETWILITYSRKSHVQKCERKPKTALLFLTIIVEYYRIASWQPLAYLLFVSRCCFLWL